MDFGDIGGAIQEMRLVLTKPDHPIEAGRNVDRLAGDRVDPLGAEARREPAHLVHRSLVEPDDGRTDRFAMLAEEAEGLALVRDRHARDTRWFDLCRELAQRQKRRAPPVFGFLFEIARARLRERDCGTPFSHRRAGTIPGNRLGGCGRGIDSDDKVALHARAQQPERRRTCASICLDAGILEKTGIFRLGIDRLRPPRPCTSSHRRRIPGRSATCPPQGKETCGNRLKPAAAITARALDFSSSHSAKEYRLDSQRRESSTIQLVTAKSKSRIRKAISWRRRLLAEGGAIGHRLDFAQRESIGIRLVAQKLGSLRCASNAKGGHNCDINSAYYIISLH